MAASDGVRRPVAGASQPAEEPPPRRRTGTIALLVGGALLLGAAGVGAYELVRGRDDHAAATVTAPTTVSTAPSTTPRGTASADGKNRYARELAGLVAGVGQRNGLTLAVRIDLIPRRGGNVTGRAAVASYRARVTGAAIAVGLVDAPTVEAWRAAGADGQAAAIRAWARLVRGLLPAAHVEIAVVGGAGTVATGTLAPGSDTVRIRLPR